MILRHAPELRETCRSMNNIMPVNSIYINYNHRCKIYMVTIGIINCACLLPIISIKCGVWKVQSDSTRVNEFPYLIRQGARNSYLSYYLMHIGNMCLNEQPRQYLKHKKYIRLVIFL